jgi:mono/diheme cytochrome c family protein
MGRYLSALASLLVVGVLVAAVGAGARPAATDQSAAAVTFSEHVAPILFKNCASCHRPGQAGPFSVLTYETVRENGGEIAEATRERYMPPWKPAPGDYPILGERRLTDVEIDTIQRWVKGGMAQGDPRKLPGPPVFNDEWRLGKPDLVVTMSEAFTVPSDGRDVYRNFVVPLNLTEDRWLKVIDYRPSARPVVHHAILSLDPSGQARELDAADPGPGFGGVMGAGGLAGRGGLQDMVARARGKAAEIMPRPARGAGAVGGWAPGGAPRPLRDDLAFFVPKGADLIVSTHFHPNGQAAEERSTFGLYFAKRPPVNGFAAIQLPPAFGAFKGINIPPGNANFVITDTFVIPAAVRAFGVGAHAHYLAKDLLLTATFPNGTRKVLLHIPDWDLNWQGTYEFKDYVDLPAGTRLDARIQYDNSAANPHNPASPPVRVTFGEQSTNEMGSINLAVVAGAPGALMTLRPAIDQHMREAIMNSPLMRGRGGRQ